jgi:hypothetical protein
VNKKKIRKFKKENQAALFREHQLSIIEAESYRLNARWQVGLPGSFN